MARRGARVSDEGDGLPAFDVGELEFGDDLDVDFDALADDLEVEPFNAVMLRIHLQTARNAADLLEDTDTLESDTLRDAIDDARHIAERLNHAANAAARRLDDRQTSGNGDARE